MNFKDAPMPSEGVLKIILTNFMGANVQTLPNEEGNLKRCVVIPIEDNNLFECANGKVSAYGYINKSIVASKQNWTHYIKLKFSAAFAEKMKRLGYKSPYIGNIKKRNYVTYRKSYENAVYTNNETLK